MKIYNIKKWLPIFSLFAATSCTNLDVDVKSQYTDSNYPTTSEDMEAVCGPAYSAMKVTYGRWYWLVQTCASDEAMMAANGGNWYDNGQYLQLNLHSWTPSNGNLETVWNGLFGAISQCNLSKSILDNAPDTDAKTLYLAQIRAMRALYMFWAMDSFGALPIIQNFGEQTPQRSTRAEVAQFIESELKDCISKLSTTVDKTTYAKPTKYMAEALLAKLYLNWAVYSASDVATYTPSAANSHWQDVVTYCDDIIQSGKYNLDYDWIAEFQDGNGYQVGDFIFALPYDWSSDNTLLSGGLTHFRFWGHKFMVYTLGLSKTPSGPLRAIPSFVDKYSLESDERNGIWRGGIQYYEGTTTPYVYKNVAKRTVNSYYEGSDGDTKVDWTFTLSKELSIRGTGSTYANNLATMDLGNDELGLAMGYRNVKFYPTKTSSTNFQSNDMPILRYADVILMKAEAILRGATATNGETAVSLVNRIRTRVGAPTVSSITLDGLLDERAREFSDENWRRNDLIRFGEFENDWGFKSADYGLSNKDTYRRVFPIPKTVLNLNTSWSQNTGYSN